MKKYKFFVLIYLVVLLVLEALPYGAVCIFAGENGEAFKETYSYFSLIPYGYANFGPFLTAMLTVVLSVFSIVRLIKESKAINNICSFLSSVALFTSVLPLLPGFNHWTVCAVCITVILFRVTTINIVLKKRTNQTFKENNTI